MGTPALNVRIGAQIKELEKGLKDAEKAVRASGKNLSDASRELSLKMTLPMLAFGAAAIKSAGEIEAIEKAMQATFAGAGRSIEEANAELVALRKAAEAPGLDFEQAVKASLRLQGVGFSAEKARNTIIQLANAISTTGGTAENLNGVTIQFAQIISKGKILTSDLNVIKENMPGLAKIMKETFGTTSAEDLRAMGVNGQEFVEKITAAMQKLPRVEGGISNAIVNAGVAVKTFLAEVGESLNKTFNVTGKLEAFSKFLSDLGDKFGGMSEGTQRAIAAVGVFALALGPMLKVGQFAVLAIGQMIAVFTALQKVLLQSLAGQAIPGAIAAFKALDMATKLTIVGAAIGVVLALAAAFTVLRKDTSDAAKAQEQLGIVETMAANSVAEQMVKVNILTATLNNNVSSLDAKKRALKELNKIAPEYFGKVKLGADVVNQATTAQNAYRESLMRTARVQAATQQLMGLEQQLNTLSQTSSASTMQTLVNVLKSGGSATQFFSEQAQTLGDNFKKSKTTIEAQRLELFKIIEANQDVAVSVKNTGDGYKDNGDAATELAKKTKVYAEALADVQKVLDSAELTGADKFNAQANAIQGGLEKILDAGYKKDSPQVKEFLDMLKAMREGIGGISDFSLLPTIQTPQSVPRQNVPPLELPEFDAGVDEKLLNKVKAFDAMTEAVDRLRKGLDGFGETWSVVTAYFAENGSILERTFVSMGNAIGNAAQSGASSFRELANAALKSAREIIGAWIRQGVAAAVSKALTSIPFPFNIAAGAAAGGLAQAAFNGVLRAIKVPAFAMGTDFAPGGLSLVGERGPELVGLPRGATVTPNHKLSSMLGSASDINVSGTFRVQGTDLLLVLEKAQKGRGRVAGY